jgi:flagellar basal-body rod modification protein FlgD
MNRKVTVTSSQQTLAAAVPAATRLGLAQPNPFRATATISFSLATSGPVNLTLYSVDGRQVRVLAQGVREAGEYSEVWDGRDEAGQTVAAGVYYALLQTSQGRFTRTVTYLK